MKDDATRARIAKRLNDVLSEQWVPARERPSERSADLLVTDVDYLRANRAAVAEKKRRARPADLPVLLVVDEQSGIPEIAVGATDGDGINDVVDDVIDQPLEKRRLEFRVGSLLEDREPSGERPATGETVPDRFAQFLETVPNPLVIADARSHEIVVVNEQLATLLGTEPDALEGEPATSLHPPQQRSAYRDLFDQHVRAAATEPARFTSLPNGDQLQVQRQDGKRVPVEISASLLEEAGKTFTMGIFWDVSEEKARQATLQRRTDRLRQAQNVANIGTWDVDISEGTIHFSPAVRAMFGLGEERSTGTFVEFLRFVHPNDRERVTTQWREALEGGDYDVEFRVETVDGPTWVRTKAQVSVGERGEPRRATGIVQDISDRKRREQIFKVSARYLRHNLRNQLTLVQGFAKRLATESQAVADADRILEHANSLLSMAEKQRLVHDITRADRQPRPIAVHTILASVAESVDETMPDAAVKISAPADGTVRALPEIDRALFELIENAVTHATGEPGSVELSVESTEDHVAMRVRDHGPGIPNTELEPLQDPSQTDHLNHGSGIGLWLVKSIVDASGGTLRFADRGEGGTIVTVRLPRSPRSLETASDRWSNGAARASR